MAKNEFRAFLTMNHPFEDTIDRHFVDDALDDDHLPDPESPEELIRYLKSQKATEKVLVAAYRTWYLYDQSKDSSMEKSHTTWQATFETMIPCRLRRSSKTNQRLQPSAFI